MRYYAGEPVRLLLQEYGVQCGPGNLWRHFPAIPTGEQCPACGGALVERFNGRTGGSSRGHPVCRCTACRHREAHDCGCSYCIARREELLQKAERQRRKAIAAFCADRWDYASRAICPEQLSARMAFALLCVVRSGGWLSPATVGALSDEHPRFAPFQLDFSNSIPLTVISSQLAAPSPDSPLEAFLDDTSGNLSWSQERVHWQLLMQDPPAFIHALEQIITKRTWPYGWIAELTDVWLELAIAECVEFCIVGAFKKGLPTPCDVALTALLKNLLLDYSVSQVFELLSASIDDAADFTERKYISKQRAESFMVGACQRRADQARSEGIAIKGLQRDPMLGRTQASFVLHDVFFGHGEDGFFRAIPRG